MSNLQFTETLRFVSVETTRTVRIEGSNVARKAIIALLDARDFLAYQLSHANGSIDDAELDRIADQYLRHETWNDQALATEVAELAELIPDRLDAEVVSTVFACDPEQASRVLVQVATADTSNLLAAADPSLPTVQGSRG